MKKVGHYLKVVKPMRASELIDRNFLFPSHIHESQFGGCYVEQVDINSTSLGLICNSWGERNWYGCLTYNGLYEGDMPHSEVDAHPPPEERMTSYLEDGWPAFTFWKKEYMEDLEYPDEDTEKDCELSGSFDEPADLSEARSGDYVYLRVVAHPKTGQLCFKPAFIDEDRLIGGLRSVRVFKATNNTVTLLEGEVITAKVKNIQETRKGTRDRRRYIFFWGEIVGIPNFQKK